MLREAVQDQTSQISLHPFCTTYELVVSLEPWVKKKCTMTTGRKGNTKNQELQDEQNFTMENINFLMILTLSSK